MDLIGGPLPRRHTTRTLILLLSLACAILPAKRASARTISEADCIAGGGHVVSIGGVLYCDTGAGGGTNPWDVFRLGVRLIKIISKSTPRPNPTEPYTGHDKRCAMNPDLCDDGPSNNSPYPAPSQPPSGSGTHTPGDEPSSVAPVGTDRPIPVPPVNWWAEFFSAIPESFMAEFRQGGCGLLFANTAYGALFPLTPSEASAGEPIALLWGAQRYNAALRYAASRTNYLGGKGLVYPMKSKVFRPMLKAAKVRFASGALLQLNIAIGKGLIVEGGALLSGRCR
jgi:hypothetical protein